MGNEATSNTSVYQNLLASVHLYTHRLHHSTASSQTVAWIDVDVFTPKALWTMVGVAITRHRKTTVFTDKILYVFFKHKTIALFLPHNNFLVDIPQGHFLFSKSLGS